MKKQGCEVEATDINYNIRTKAAEQPSKIFRKFSQLNREEDGREAEDEEKTEQRSCSGVRHVLKNVNCIAKPLEILAIVGPSGAGKSSLLKILAGKASSQSGCILVNQEPVDTAEGRTIILTIHQPGYRMVKLFNSILLLADGIVLHHGSVDFLGVNLRLMGLEIPLHVNVVEFAIDYITTIQQHKKCQQVQLEASWRLPRTMLQEKCDEQGESRSGKFTLQQLFQQSKLIDEETISAGMDITFDFANSVLRETMILTHRFSKNIVRTKELFACRTIQMLVSGLVLGSVFCNLKDGMEGVEERVGLFAFILTFMLSSTTEALPIFLQERDIILKEISSGSYRVSSYAIANGLVSLPFLLILAILFTVPLYWLIDLNRNFSAFLYFLMLIWLILYTANSVVVCFSAAVPNFIVGNSMIAGAIGSFLLFSGYFISKQQIPSYWIFMHYMSPFKYPFEGFLINEFSNSKKCLEYLFGACVVRGEDVLKLAELGGETSRWKNVGVMVCFILVSRFIYFVILRYRCSQGIILKS
ncbi:ABC transporter G family member 5 [Vigna angularis]|uniref:ABC transporter G family member 5 n=1 Tax=Phaseolus angularis TaxID=3914 RepID=A0A8T0KK28_PHAAN|nr:ABC transporter G family member 5 [Vigna angularis]